jgi:hypothetical protein
MREAVALGFRPHTYWTAAVALAGPRDAPRVIERRRIDFAAGDERHVYHHVEGMAPDEATKWIAKTRVAVLGNTQRGVDAFVKDLAASGLEPAAAIVPVGRKKAPDRLEDVLKSHSQIHAAEGDFYRAVVAEACAALGLEVRRVVERDLPALVSALIEAPPIEARLRAMGQTLGPPWTEDQKLATLAAWSALEAE